MSWIMVTIGAVGATAGGLGGYFGTSKKNRKEKGTQDAILGALGGATLGLGGAGLLGIGAGGAAAGAGLAGGAGTIAPTTSMGSLGSAFGASEATMPILSAPASFGGSAPLLSSTGSLGSSTFALGGGSGGLGSSFLGSSLPEAGSLTQSGMGGQNDLLQNFLKNNMNKSLGQQSDTTQTKSAKSDIYEKLYQAQMQEMFQNWIAQNSGSTWNPGKYPQVSRTGGL